MTPKDKLFYQQLGQRIARFRKAQNLTQQQLADLLGVAQQTLTHCEMARLRIAVAALPPLAEALVVSAEELLEDQPSTPEVVIERVRYLEVRFAAADDTNAETGQLVKLLGNFKIGGKQVHDGNIVATMLAYGIPCLLTHNVRDFERFAEVIRIERI